MSDYDSLGFKGRMQKWVPSGNFLKKSSSWNQFQSLTIWVFEMGLTENKSPEIVEMPLG